MKAYCFKCRASRQMKSAKQITMRNGRPGAKGACPACGGKMFRLGKV